MRFAGRLHEEKNGEDRQFREMLVAQLINSISRHKSRTVRRNGTSSVHALPARRTLFAIQLGIVWTSVEDFRLILIVKSDSPTSRAAESFRGR